MGDPKVGLRTSIREQLRLLPRSTVAARSERIAGLLFESELWRDSGAIFSFLSLSTEVDTELINDATLAAGKLLALPRIEGEHLSFRRVTNLAGPWERNSYRIREPPAGLPPISPGALGEAALPALLLVPGLAFDRRGNRLGRGKGFYDRLLAATGAPGGISGRNGREAAASTLRGMAAGLTSVGLCFAAQLAREVPVGPLDRRVDLLLTEEGLLRSEALEQQGDHR